MAARLLQAPQSRCCARLSGPVSAWCQGMMTAAANAPVVIVGAGPTGLTLSKLLSQLGVQSVVLERAQTVTKHPQVLLRQLAIKRRPVHAHMTYQRALACDGTVICTALPPSWLHHPI